MPSSVGSSHGFPTRVRAVHKGKYALRRVEHIAGCGRARSAVLTPGPVAGLGVIWQREAVSFLTVWAGCQRRVFMHRLRHSFGQAAHIDGQVGVAKDRVRDFLPSC
jgi:hypothetical protein